MVKRVSPNQPHKKDCGAAGRLIEYFVVVSVRQCEVDATECRGQSASLQTNADAQTKTRLAMRRAHMPGETASYNIMRLSSIADCSAVSTSSTCGSEETDISALKMNAEVTPSSVSLDAISLSAPKILETEQRCVLEPVITARYPATDRLEHPLNPRLPQFCHREGSEYIYPSSEYKMPKVHYFVMSSDTGKLLYGTCLTVYEDFDQDATEDSQECGKKKTYYAPRVLCLLSTYPYLTAFRSYLTQLYRLATTTDLMEAPIERYILNICEEVPAPQPGEFEVQLSILGSTVRFWAPPANQPIAYVSLPFHVLFECLDISNVMYTWYSLACERKILLVSDQLSLLTTCTEILCSLLFPLKWSHIYIPLLPRSLSPMLDAPFPYLCGISRENFPYAVSNISEETVIVDLDKNVISVGPATPNLPPIPHQSKVKLEASLQKHAGHVFWDARGISPGQMNEFRRSGNKESVKQLHEKAQTLLCERSRVIDDAFNLAPAPESSSILYNQDGSSQKQSRWDAIQEAFLNFFASALKDYKKFTPKGSRTRVSWRGPDRSKHTFKSDDFVASQRSDFKPFIEELVQTQAFDTFITRRMYNASNVPDVTFFDKTIDAQKNKSMLQVKKADTTFLHSANAHRELHQYTAVLPNQDDIPASDFASTGSNGHQVYTYPNWPETLESAMFGTPRPFPKDISAEFKRTITLSGGRFFVVPRDPFEDYHDGTDL